MIDAGFLYHYEKIPTYINPSNFGNNPPFRSIESYNFKLYYGYIGDRLSFKNSLNTQIINYLRPLTLEQVDLLEYLAQTNWNKINKFKYSSY